MNDLDLAWAAGLFEGEGCISMRREGRKRLSVTLSSSDEDVVRRFYEVVGVGTVLGPYRPSNAKPHYKDFWRWSADGPNALQLMSRSAFVSFLGERRTSRLNEVMGEINHPSNPKPRKGSTECGRGHVFNEKNTRWYRGQRCCRTCARERARAETLFKKGIESSEYTFRPDTKKRLLAEL